MHKRKNVLPDISTFQLYPLGDAAIVIQFGDTITLNTHRHITALAAYLSDHPFTGFTELVPAYTSLTLYYDPWVVSHKGQINPYQKVVELLQGHLTKANLQAYSNTPRLVEIPVCYGGSFGPDLDFVAAHNNLTTEEVVETHCSADYTVYMIGFAPGFPYLGGLPEKIAAPRRETPRTIIPAGSVGIAGQQTGIYPLETPGGWQLIGRTPLSLFDLDRTQPALLQAGDVIRFVPISAIEFEERKELQE